MNPTAEQTAALDAFKTKENLVVEAGAGTGKTSTLKLMANSTTAKGAYIAFNRAIAQDAKASFPDYVRCGTSHSFAFGPVGKKFLPRMNLKQRPKGLDSARILDIEEGFLLPEGGSLNRIAIARLAQETVARYCYTDDTEILPKHVPMVPGTDDVSWDLAEYVVPFARKAWADLSRPTGKLFFQQDVYLKLWALSEPKLPYEYIFVDEAQDTNPCLMGVVLNQDAQLIAVGDRSQAIYGWRGARDAMGSFPAEQRVALTQSFRFGQAVADEANFYLGLLDAPIRLSGYDKIKSSIGPVESPKAVLCRTNAGVIAAALATPDDESYAIVGGAGPIKTFAKAAAILMRGTPVPWHSDLAEFDSWADAEAYADKEHGGADIKTLVNLCRDFGPEEIERIAERAVPEGRADRVLSTAHKAKGREWDTVRIASDFTPDGERAESPLSNTEAMLAYVASTRAQTVLDNSGLSWAKGV